MRGTLKKLTIALLIVVLIFQFLYGNFVPVYGIEIEDGVTWVVNTLTNLLGGVIGIHTWIYRLIAMGLGFGVNILTAQIAYMDGETPDATGGALSRITITPFEIFFNEIQLLDVNFLDINVGGTTQIIRKAVAEWYYVSRLIATSILLLILIYVGIRMALSSVASEKAIYKKALMDWATSLALVFLLQYIIMFTINANNALVKAMKAAVITTNVDDKILGIAMLSLGISFESIAATVVYCVFIFQVLMFLIKYIKRMITIAFLIIISPLISITYSIDKLGDGKAQALNTWLKEFVYNILIQPFHCVIYMAFIDTAFSLLAAGGDSVLLGILSMIPSLSGVSDLANGLLAIVCMWFVDDAEKIVKKIFGLDAASSLTSKITTMVVASSIFKGGKAVAGAAPKIRKSINALAGTAKNTAGFIGKQTDKLAKTKVGQGVIGAGKAIGKPFKAVGNALGDVGEKIGKWTGGKAQAMKDGISNNQKQNAIEKEMRAQLGEHEYSRLKSKKDSDSTAAGDWERARASAEQKVNERTEQKKERRQERNKKLSENLTSFRGTVSNTLRDNLAGGVGFFFGAALSDHPIEAFASANAASELTTKLLKTSTSTIANEAGKYLTATNEADAKAEMDDAYVRGENGGFDKTEWDSLIKELQAVLGDNKQGRDAANKIRISMLRDGDADVRKILTDMGISPEKLNDSNVISSAESCKEFQRESNLYNQIKLAQEVGIGTGVLAGRINFDQVRDTAAPAAEDEQSGTPPAPAAEPVKIDQVVRHINEGKSVQEIINTVEDQDVATLQNLVKQLDKKIEELKDSDTNFVEQGRELSAKLNERIRELQNKDQE